MVKMMHQSFVFMIVLSCALLLFALPATLAHRPDLDASRFKKSVLEDDKVWLVEFYSSMCGGCQEFASTWDKIENEFSKSVGKIVTGKISIDNKAGLKVAEELGVLEDGVPHVRMFSRKGDPNGVVIVKGNCICFTLLFVKRALIILFFFH
jgi:thiol-disulfide isomerase/thioredoxin